MKAGRTRPRMVGAILAVSILAAACGGSDDASPPKAGEQEAPESLTVTSDDGLLSVEIPAGAVPDEEITVRTLAPEELPEELQGFELRGAVHELGPDGMQFSEPVTVTRRVDTESLGFDPAEGVPVVTLFSRDSDGTWSVLDDQSVTSEGAQAVATGTTRHFSTVAAFGGNIQVSMRPDDVTLEVGQDWTSRVRLREMIERETDLGLRTRGLVGDERVVLTLAIEGDAPGGDRDPFTSVEANPGQRFFCRARGESSFAVVVTFREYIEVTVFARLLGIPEPPRATQKVVLPGQALCTGGGGVTDPPQEEPMIERGCAYWEHEGSDTAFGHLFALSSVKPGELATIRADGVDGEEPISAVVERDDQGLFVQFPGRINEFGGHLIIDFRVEDEEGNVSNLTKQARRVIGDGEVDSEPTGTIGDCGWLERLIP